MATNAELRSTQKRILFTLLKVVKKNPNLEIAELNEQIIHFIAEMEAEDVAYVEKLIERLP